MRADLAETPFALAVGRLRSKGSAGLECLESQTTGPVVLGCDALEDVDAFGIFAFADEELWCFLEADHKDPGHGHGEYKSSRGVPNVSPALIIRSGTGGCIWEVGGILAGVIGQESPRKKPSNKLADT